MSGVDEKQLGALPISLPVGLSWNDPVPMPPHSLEKTEVLRFVPGIQQACKREQKTQWQTIELTGPSSCPSSLGLRWPRGGGCS